MIRLDMVPVRTSGGYRYDVFLDDEVLVARSRVPFCDACRALAVRGLDGKVGMGRRGSSQIDMTGSVATTSPLTVEEGARGGPRFTRWVPFTGFNRDDQEEA